MLAIQFDFTANRYHATQWGRHVNEGVLEWPPSPWRILRAIVATWRRTLPDLPEDRVVPLLEQLASEHPLYRLPPASTGHTRHYMPYNEGIRERTTLVIDSFVAIQPAEPVVALWSGIELDIGRPVISPPYSAICHTWDARSHGWMPLSPRTILNPTRLQWWVERSLPATSRRFGRLCRVQRSDCRTSWSRPPISDAPVVSTRRAPSGGCTLARRTVSPRSGPSTVAAVRRAQPPRWCGSHFRATCCPWSGTRCAGAIWRADPQWHGSEDRTAMGSPPRCQEGASRGSR